MGGNHGSVRCFIEFHAQVVQPLNGFGSVADQLCQKLSFGCIVSAAEGIHKVNGRRIVGLICRLNAALGHHGVGVAQTKLGYDHSLCAGTVGLNRRRSTGSASANNQHIHIVFYIVQVHILGRNTTVGLQHFAKLMGHQFALIGPDFQGGELTLFIVRMICRKQFVLFLGGHAGGLVGNIFRPCGFYCFERCLKFL